MTSIWSILLCVYHLLKRVCFLNLSGTMFYIYYQLRQVGPIFYMIPDVCVFLLVTTVTERSVLKSPTMSVHLSVSPFSFVNFALDILNNIIGSNRMRIVFPFLLTLYRFIVSSLSLLVVLVCKVYCYYVNIVICAFLVKICILYFFLPLCFQSFFVLILSMSLESSM